MVTLLPLGETPELSSRDQAGSRPGWWASTLHQMGSMAHFPKLSQGRKFNQGHLKDNICPNSGLLNPTRPPVSFLAKPLPHAHHVLECMNRLTASWAPRPQLSCSSLCERSLSTGPPWDLFSPRQAVVPQSLPDSVSARFKPHSLTTVVPAPHRAGSGGTEPRKWKSKPQSPWPNGEASSG